MRVDESRQQKPFAKLDDLRRRSLQSEHVGLRTDSNDAITADGDRSRLRLTRVDGPDPSAAKDQAAGSGRRTTVRARRWCPARTRFAMTRGRTGTGNTHPPSRRAAPELEAATGKVM